MKDKCKIMEPLIINLAFNDGNPFKRIKAYFHIKKCEDCAALFKEYKAEAKAIHNLPEIECPEELIKNTEKIIGKPGFTTPSFLSDLAAIFSRVRLRFAATGFAVVVCVALGIFFIREKHVEKPRQYSFEEIKNADYQAKQALAYVGKILNGTQTKLKEEILSKHVTKPLEKSITVINDLFETGGKNENN